MTVEPEFFVEVVKLARRYGFMVISDFAYADVAFDGYQPPSFLAAPGAKEVGVEFTTMSKGYNMAGWRVGFCCGNAEMVRALGIIKGYYDYGMFQAIQIAAIVALRHTDAAVEAQSRLYQGRRDVLLDGLRKQGWEVETPRAGMFVWAKYPEPWASTMSTLDFAMKLLEEANVAVSPGSGFGPAGEGYVRMALVENENRLRQAVRQIGRLLGSRRPNQPNGSSDRRQGQINARGLSLAAWSLVRLVSSGHSLVQSPQSLKLLRVCCLRNKKGGLLLAATRGLPYLAVSDLGCPVVRRPTAVVWVSGAAAQRL